MRIAPGIALVVGTVLITLGVLQSRGENPPAGASGHELIHPKPTTSATRPAHQLSYRLAEGNDQWDPDVRARIIKAMDEAVAIYNANGKFDRVVPVVYSPGTPTADASYNGQIRFGGQIGTRTALHELGHIMGVGTHPNWMKFNDGGKWTGEYALKVLHDLDGPDAVLHCDRQHFWPYGLNYDNEGGAENFVKHVKIVQAFRVDLGIDPPPPTTAPVSPLEVAHQAVADAKANVNQADRALTLLTRGLQSSVDSRPEVAAASKAAQQAKLTYDQAVAAAIKPLADQPDYQSAKAQQAKAQKQLDTLREDSGSSYSDRSAAATAMMSANAAVTAFESAAIAKSADVAAAKTANTSAADALAKARQTAMEQDARYITARRSLDDARAKLKTAEVALADAQKSSVK